MALRFSEWFKLGRTQRQLDFVDIDLESDIPLFVDPYAISLETSDWFVECNNLIVDFFQLLIETMKNGDEAQARAMLTHLGEPNDTQLGLSVGRPRGNGIGPIQSQQIYEKLVESEAVKTGSIATISDAELVIPGIGRDKISDMTTNIIREPLIRYTQDQCALFGIPLENVNAGVIWDAERKIWASRYAELPCYGNRSITLVPKVAVRRRVAVYHQDYYNKEILEYLQAEHTHAHTSLVTVLKNGKRVVYKKDLREQVADDLAARGKSLKDYIYEFTESHPEILEKYKEKLSRESRPLSDEQIEESQTEPKSQSVLPVITRLLGIQPGHDAATEFHSFIHGALVSIFYPHLVNPKKELEINEGRKRIDISFTNRAQSGFFHAAHEKHGIHCPYIFFECKNYQSDIKNPELDQLSGRFSDRRGRLGFIVCRSIDNRDELLKRQRDYMKDKGEFILVLDDSDITAMLEARENGDDQAVQDLLEAQLATLVLG